MKIKIPDFEKKDGISLDINKYREKVPSEVIEFWEEYGIGSFSSGYIKSINPGEYEDILTSGSNRFTDAIVLFVTALGDLIIWSDGYVRVLNFRYGVNDTIMAGFDFFFEDIIDENFQKKYLKSDQYTQALEILGKPDYAEGYGYFPLLGAGGTEDVNRLQKVLIKEHILTIISLVGAIS